jgi:hypothetical protein
MGNPVHLVSARQPGAQAVPMSWGEVYASLQTGVIDGQGNTVAIVFAFKLSEVQKYLERLSRPILIFLPASIVVLLICIYWEALVLAIPEAVENRRVIIFERLENRSKQDQIDNFLFQLFYQVKKDFPNKRVNVK